MRRRIDKEEGFAEGELVEKWSKKRLLAALATLLSLGGLGYFAFNSLGERAKEVLGSNKGPEIVNKASVKGLSAEEVKLPTKEDVDNILEEVRAKLQTITSENITASQAAVQKAIQDLQSIQSGSQSPVGAFCELVCKK